MVTPHKRRRTEVPVNYTAGHSQRMLRVSSRSPDPLGTCFPATFGANGTDSRPNPRSAHFRKKAPSQPGKQARGAKRHATATGRPGAQGRGRPQVGAARPRQRPASPTAADPEWRDNCEGGGTEAKAPSTTLRARARRDPPPTETTDNGRTAWPRWAARHHDWPLANELAWSTTTIAPDLRPLLGDPPARPNSRNFTAGSSLQDAGYGDRPWPA